MIEKVEWFYGALRFTPFWGIVDFFLILHFCVSWYRSARKTGWKIDFWYLTLFLGAFQSILVLYPFNGSMYNAVSTVGFYEKIVPFIDMAFFISILGYLSLWIGRYLFDYAHGIFPVVFLFQLAAPICQMVENNIKSKRAYLFVAVGTVALGLVILSIQFKAGYFFNGREWFLMQPALRPLFNVTISVFPIAFAFLGLRYIQFKEKRCLNGILLLLLLTFFLGVRSTGLRAIMLLFSLWIFYREGRFSFFKFITGCFFLFLSAVILGELREGGGDVLYSFFLAAFKFFYGNNFSDTRDFAWILSFWDGEYLYGKTYLAALISFIPRALSSIREEWSISMYTNALIGFNSETMPGLRPGMFGEAFFNFSYPGVVMFGLLLGFSLRYADVKIKEYVMKSKDVIKGYSHILVFSFLSELCISAGIWSFYVFMLINFAMVLVRGRVKSQSIPRYIKGFR